MTSSGLRSTQAQSLVSNWNHPAELGIRIRTARNILLVGKYQQESILHFSIIDDLVKFGASLLDSSGVARIDDEDQALGTCMDHAGVSNGSRAKRQCLGV